MTTPTTANKIQMPDWVKAVFLFTIVFTAAKTMNSIIMNAFLMRNFNTALNLDFAKIADTINQTKLVFLLTPITTFAVAALAYIFEGIQLHLPKKFLIVFSLLLLVLGGVFSYAGYSSFSGTMPNGVNTLFKAPPLQSPANLPK